MLAINCQHNVCAAQRCLLTLCCLQVVPKEKVGGSAPRNVVERERTAAVRVGMNAPWALQATSNPNFCSLRPLTGCPLHATLRREASGCPWT